MEHTKGKIFQDGKYIQVSIPEDYVKDLDYIRIRIKDELCKSKEELCLVPTDIFATETTKANADRLCHCWNTHDRLINALKAILETIPDPKRQLPLVAEIKEIAEAALAAENNN